MKHSTTEATRISSTSVGPRLQCGAVLGVSLIFLVLISLMAVSVSWQATMQSHQSAGARQSSLALQGAESGLRYAERWIYTHYERSQGEPLVGRAGTLVVPTSRDASGASVSGFFDGARWAEDIGAPIPSDAVDYMGSEPTSRLYRQPRFLIEDLGRLVPAGASSVREGESTGGHGYSGSGGSTPAGNAELRVYRITAKSTGSSANPVRTLQSTFAGRSKT